MPQVYYAGGYDKEFTLIAGNDTSKQVFNISHVKLRDYKLPKNVRKDLELSEYQSIGGVVISEGGNFIFVAGYNVICIYRKEIDEPIYKYKFRNGYFHNYLIP